MGRSNQLPFLVKKDKKFYVSQEKAKTALYSIGYIEKEPNRFFLVFLRREDNKILLLEKEEAERKIGFIHCNIHKNGLVRWSKKPVLRKPTFLDNVVFGELDEEVYQKEIDEILNDA